MKIAVVTAGGDTVIRFCAEDADVLAEVSLLSRRVVEGRAALGRAGAPLGPSPEGALAAAPGAEVARVVISVGERAPRIKAPEAPRCTNLCGKVAHYPNTDIYKKGVRPYVRRTKSLFGAFTCVYTKHANFHTGSARSSTLFRGGTSTERIKHAIAHIFADCVVHSVLVHNCVFTGNLGVPVSRSNGAVQRSLEAAFECDAQPLMAIDEQMFAVSLLLKDFRAPLVEVAPGDSPVASVRVNICRTGVLNIFIAAPGGVDARTHLDETLLPVAHRLFAAIARVV